MTGVQTCALPIFHRGEGKVEKISKDEVTLSHGPIPSLQWGAMTMGFRIPGSGLPKEVAAGDTVSFEFRQTQEGRFEITRITPSPTLPLPGGGKGGGSGRSKP